MPTKEMLRTVGLIRITSICAALFMSGCVTGQRMETRAYKVDDVFWRSVAGPNTPANDISDKELASGLRDFLSRADITFQPGAFIRLSRKDNLVIMRNVSQELDRMESIMGPMTGKGSFYSERIK